VSHLVVHPPRAEPAPAVTANLHRAAANWAANRDRAKALVDWEAWRERARAIRADAVDHLPELVDRLEERVTALGGVVHRAVDGDEAGAIVAGICRAAGATVAVKTKSMTGEEIGLNAALAGAGVRAVETDLGEWIVQERGDRPSHILAPAVHLSAAQVAAQFAARSGRAFDADDTEGLVRYARGELRAEFLRAGVGITGVNAAVAETGTLVLIESEGNARLSTSLPRVHVAVMGIEKVVRDLAGAAHLAQMASLAAHGRLAAGSVSFITGPARDGDDGPRELHLVLLDGGRAAMREGPLREALHCIRCGACLYACPVYRQVGGHHYGSTYTGPIGAVVTPGLADARDGTGDLAWLSSLCGACAEACPVKIPLDEQLVTIRAMAHEREPRRAEQALFAAWGRLWARPAGYRATAATTGRALAPAWRRLAGAGRGAGAREGAATPGAGGGDGWVARVPFPFSGWTSQRDARAPVAEPFHVRWRRRRG
jgi:L-lactate dehydrogenase complex protein LldF